MTDINKWSADYLEGIEYDDVEFVRLEAGDPDRKGEHSVLLHLDGDCVDEVGFMIYEEAAAFATIAGG